MDKFSGKYRIDTTRLKKWNYAWKGFYFVTISTRGFKNHFGEIIDDKMIYNKLGFEVEQQWMKTVELRPDMNIILEDFQVMPNHFHGIVGIGKNEYNSLTSENLKANRNLLTENQFGPQRKNLGSIIRGFKSSITSFARNNHILFDWHPLFHDHLIRNNSEMQKIKKYIQNNVKNWKKDRFKKC